jgi:tetratricopeptide (TPR) repeat protein
MVKNYFNKKTLSTTALGLLFVATLSSQPVWGMNQPEDFNETARLAKIAKTPKDFLNLATIYKTRNSKNSNPKAIDAFEKAIKLLEVSANLDQASAIYKLAKLNEEGVTVGGQKNLTLEEVLPQDLKEAVTLYKKVITLNNDNGIVAKALNKLKTLYLGNEDVVIEDGDSLYLLGKSIEENVFEINTDSVKDQKLKLFQEAKKFGNKLADTEIENLNPKPTVIMTSIPLKFKKLYAKEYKDENGILTIKTDNNKNATYQAETQREKVTLDDEFEISYDITVENGGKMSFGVLNTKRDGWIDGEVILETGVHNGGIKNVKIPAGESEISLVLRNYHLGIPGESKFTAKLGLNKK